MLVAILFSVVAILAGLLAASNVVISRLPDAKKLVTKLEPYQAGIGIAALALGVAAVLDGRTILGRQAGFSGYFWLWSCAIASLALGFLLGYPLLQRWFLNDTSQETQDKAENLRKKLLGYQVMAGLAAMATGGFLLLRLLLWR